MYSTGGFGPDLLLKWFGIIQNIYKQCAYRFCRFAGGSIAPSLTFVLPDVFFEVDFELALRFLPLMGFA
jgi:hypothetical protein